MVMAEGTEVTACILDLPLGMSIALGVVAIRQAHGHT